MNIEIIALVIAISCIFGSGFVTGFYIARKTSKLGNAITEIEQLKKENNNLYLKIRLMEEGRC